MWQSFPDASTFALLPLLINKCLLLILDWVLLIPGLVRVVSLQTVYSDLISHKDTLPAKPELNNEVLRIIHSP